MKDSRSLPLRLAVVLISAVSCGGDATDLDPCFESFGVTCEVFEEALLAASNPDTNDRFGGRVALDGDTLAVGAIGEAGASTGVDGEQSSNVALESGAVYVYTRSGGAWEQQAYLKASNSEGGDRFGFSIALSGDTLAVGSLREGSAATGVDGDQSSSAALQSGAVYVFARSGTTWTQQAYVKASNTDGMDAFGSSVALDGDTLAIGATGESSAATGVNGDQSSNTARSSGAVYVFVRTSTTWQQQAYIKASNTEGGDQFGGTVALDGDTLAIGATGESSAATGVNGDQSSNTARSSGAVYVFVRTSTTWQQQAYIKASNTEGGDQFGGTVALNGDTLAAGAIGEDSDANGVDGNQDSNGAPSSGAVYVLTRSGATWQQQAYIKAANTDLGDRFGVSLALDDGTLAVGASNEDSSASGVNGNQSSNAAMESGAVYVFAWSGTTWRQQAYVKSSNPDAGDFFGASVAVDAGKMAVGALFESSNDVVASGVVFIRRIAD